MLYIFKLQISIYNFFLEKEKDAANTSGVNNRLLQQYKQIRDVCPAVKLFLLLQKRLEINSIAGTRNRASRVRVDQADYNVANMK